MKAFEAWGAMDGVRLRNWKDLDVEWHRELQGFWVSSAPVPAD